MFTGSRQKRTNSLFGTPLKKKAGNPLLDASTSFRSAARPAAAAVQVLSEVPEAFQDRTPHAIVVAKNGQARCVVYPTEGDDSASGCELVFWSKEVSNGMYFDSGLLDHRNIALIPDQFGFHALIVTSDGQVHFLRNVTQASDDVSSTTISLRNASVAAVTHSQGMTSIVTSDGQWYDVFMSAASVSCRKIAQKQEGSLLLGISQMFGFSAGSGQQKSVRGAVQDPSSPSSLLVTTDKGVELWASPDRKNCDIVACRILEAGSELQTELEVHDSIEEFEMVDAGIIDSKSGQYKDVAALLVTFPVVQPVRYYLATWRVLESEGGRLDRKSVTQLPMDEPMQDDREAFFQKRLFAFSLGTLVIADEAKGTVQTILGAQTESPRLAPTIISSSASAPIRVAGADDARKSLLCLCISDASGAWNLCRCPPEPAHARVPFAQKGPLGRQTPSKGASIVFGNDASALSRRGAPAEDAANRSSATLGVPSRPTTSSGNPLLSSNAATSATAPTRTTSMAASFSQFSQSQRANDSTRHATSASYYGEAEPSTLREAVAQFMDGAVAPFAMEDEDVLALSEHILDSASHDPRWAETRRRDAPANAEDSHFGGEGSRVISTQLERKIRQHAALTSYIEHDAINYWENVSTRTQARLNDGNEFLHVALLLRELQTSGVAAVNDLVLEPLDLSSEDFYAKVSQLFPRLLPQLSACGTIEAIALAARCCEAAVESRRENLQRYNEHAIAELWTSSPEAANYFHLLFESALRLKTKQGNDYAQFFAEMILTGLSYKAAISMDTAELLSKSDELGSALATWGAAPLAIDLCAKFEAFDTVVTLAHKYDCEDQLAKLRHTAAPEHKEQLSNAVAKFYVKTKQFHSRLLEESLIDANVEKSLSAQPELQWLHFLERGHYESAAVGLANLGQKETNSSRRMLMNSLSLLCSAASEDDDFQLDLVAGEIARLRILNALPADIRAQHHCTKSICSHSELLAMCKEYTSRICSDQGFEEVAAFAAHFCLYLVQYERDGKSIVSALDDDRAGDALGRQAATSDILQSFMKVTLSATNDDEMRLRDCVLAEAIKDLSDEESLWLAGLVDSSDARLFAELIRQGAASATS